MLLYRSYLHPREHLALIVRELNVADVVVKELVVLCNVLRGCPTTFDANCAAHRR